MIYTGILNAADKIRKAIEEQVAKGTTPPVAAEKTLSETPQNIDYTKGMTAPDITTIRKNMKFEGTPNRSSAFLVALGNILQDQNNVKAAQEEVARNEYNAKLQDALDLNKLQQRAKIERDWSETDPMQILKRKQIEGDLAMQPLEKEYKQTQLDFLLKKKDNYGNGGGGGGKSPEVAASNIPQDLTKEQVMQNIKNAKTKKEQDFWKGKISAFEGNNGVNKITWAAGADPNDGFVYEYHYYKDGSMKPTGLKKKVIVNPMNILMQNAMGTQTTEGAPVGPVAPAPVQAPQSGKPDAMTRAKQLQAAGVPKDKAKEIMSGEGY